MSYPSAARDLLEHAKGDPYLQAANAVFNCVECTTMRQARNLYTDIVQSLELAQRPHSGVAGPMYNLTLIAKYAEAKEEALELLQATKEKVYASAEFKAYYAMRAFRDESESEALAQFE